MRPDDELQELWQTQKVEEEKMSPEEIRTKAKAFEDKIRSPVRAADPFRAAAGLLIFAAFIIAVLFGVSSWNKRIMKRLQGEIDALSRQ